MKCCLTSVVLIFLVSSIEQTRGDFEIVSSNASNIPESEPFVSQFANRPRFEHTSAFFDPHLNIQVYTLWQSRSGCSRCNATGFTKKMGICFVKVGVSM